MKSIIHRKEPNIRRGITYDYKEHTLRRSTFYKVLSSFTLAVLISCFFLTHQQIHAQTSKKTIKGKVIDAFSKEPVPYASIVLKSKENQKIITGGITEDNGSFQIKDLAQTVLIFEVQYIGYKTYSRELTLNGNTTDVGTIEITENVEQLEGVEIVVERSTIEQKIDRKVINVGKDLTTTGATAADIMVNVPSVDIDQDGNLSFRGNQNVRVLIDGKLTNIAPDQLLRQIPSTSIKKIELITNPSAKYNPEGMSGIINIILYKSSQMGFNGILNLGVTQGQETRSNNSIDLNYRINQFNVYGNYGNTLGENFLNGDIFRPGENSDQTWRNNSDNTSHLFKVGMDFYLSDQTTLSFFTTQNYFDGEDIGTTDIVYLDGDIPDLTQFLENFRDNQTSSYNFDILHKFNEDGHSIELEADFNSFDEDIQTNFDFDGGDSSFVAYTDNIDNARENLFVNLDYVNPINETTKLEFGAQSLLRRTDNSYRTTNDVFRDSEFEYDMDIHSVYGIISQNFSKWSYQIGARVESYDVDGIFLEEGGQTQNITDYIFTVYPSMYVNYTPNEETKKNSYQLSYGRRVDRPSVAQISPIRAWNTPRITSEGNPDLRPQFTNSFEFNYIRKIKGGSINTGVFYRFITDEIVRIGIEDPEDPSRIILTYLNYQDNSAFGFELGGSYKFNSWWNANASFDLFAQTQRGTIGNEFLEVDNLILNFRINNSFKVNKKLTFQLFSLFRGPSENLQFKVEPFYFVNFGARYSLLDRKATISLNFNDIFETRLWGFDGERPLPQIGEFVWDTRSVYLGFSYNFGQGKNKAAKRKKRDTNEKKGGGGIL
jgi:outer membrane receptor protein involved in Fe transport